MGLSTYLGSVHIRRFHKSMVFQWCAWWRSLAILEQAKEDRCALRKTLLLASHVDSWLTYHMNAVDAESQWHSITRRPLLLEDSIQRAWWVFPSHMLESYASQLRSTDLHSQSCAITCVKLLHHLQRIFRNFVVRYAVVCENDRNPWEWNPCCCASSSALLRWCSSRASRFLV